MENTENVAVVEEPKKSGPSIGAKVKEFFRKQAVKLKRKPQRIAFLFLAIVTIYNLLTLATYSEAIVGYAFGQDWVGLMVFINTLFSILVLVAFLNTFPKFKKPGSKTVFTMTESGVQLHVNVVMLAVVLFMTIAMIVCEALYHSLLNPFYLENYVNIKTTLDENALHAKALIESSFRMSIAHIVLLSIFLVILLTLPLYRKLIMKINTSKQLETSELKEAIDTVD